MANAVFLIQALDGKWDRQICRSVNVLHGFGGNRSAAKAMRPIASGWHLTKRDFEE
jgi:hypothetical protein